jgi:hypothetical protein
MLRSLDYAFSNTVLVSAFLLVFPLVTKPYDTIEFTLPNGLKKEINTIYGPRWEMTLEDRDRFRIASQYTHVEVYTLVAFFALVYLSMSGPLLCSGRYAFNFIIVIIVAAVVIGVIGRTILYNWYNIQIIFNKRFLLASVVFGILAMIPFIVEGALDPSSYWITHSLWHLLAAVALLCVVEARYSPSLRLTFSSPHEK